MNYTETDVEEAIIHIQEVLLGDCPDICKREHKLLLSMLEDLKELKY